MAGSPFVWGLLARLEATASRHVTFSNRTPDDHGRKRRRFAATPLPRRDPKTGYTAVLFRGLEDISSESEEEVPQPTKRRRLSPTPPSYTGAEDPRKVLEDEDQIAALLSFSLLDSNCDGLIEKWLDYIVDISIEDLEDWSDTTAMNSSDFWDSSPIVESEGVDSYHSATPDDRPSTPNYPQDRTTIIDLHSATPEPRNPSYPASPSFSPER